MALNKTITVTRQLQNNQSPEVAVSFTAEAVVTDGVLTAGHKVLNPGVFTAGTPKEGTSPNTHQ